MNKIATLICFAIFLASILGLVGCNFIFPDEYVPADDEIALHVRLNIKEDIGLLVYDYSADGSEYSGGISNSDRSLIKHGSELIIVFNRQELVASADSVDLSMQFRIIAEYITPNFENVYPSDITEHAEPISFKADFGKSYYITITGDRASGYKIYIE
ncbi:MAG: hypothetical protein ACI3XL_00505 [Eubacteriales bacterium]